MMKHSMFDLSARVAVVTGGASGIGLGIVEVLAEAGATVVIVDRDEAAGRDQADRLAASDLKVDFVRIDVGEESSVVSGCADIVGRHETPWVLVNNAGIQDRQMLLESTVDFWDRTLAINTRGAFLMSRELARPMIASGEGGRIVNVASASLIGSLCKGHAAYASSKAALPGLSWAVGLELVEHHITVNTVLPGGVATPGSRGAQGPRPEGPGYRPPPLGLSEPRDIGAAVLFFAAPAAARITNQTLAVDAGWSLS